MIRGNHQFSHQLVITMICSNQGEIITSMKCRRNIKAQKRYELYTFISLICSLFHICDLSCWFFADVHLSQLTSIDCLISRKLVNHELLTNTLYNWPLVGSERSLYPFNGGAVWSYHEWCKQMVDY